MGIWRHKEGFLRKIPQVRAPGLDRSRTAPVSRISVLQHNGLGFLFLYCLTDDVTTFSRQIIPAKRATTTLSRPGLLLLDLTLSEYHSFEKSHRTLFVGLFGAFGGWPPTGLVFRDATSYEPKGRLFTAHRVAETHIRHMMVEAGTGCRQGPRFCFP
jgi:hypothetical protein